MLVGFKLLQIQLQEFTPVKFLICEVLSLVCDLTKLIS